MAQKFNIDQNLIFKAGIAIGVYFLVIKPITEKLGIKDTAVEKKEEKKAAENLETQETKINIWQGVDAAKRAAGAKTSLLILTYSSAVAKAKGIYNSISMFNDNEERIYSIFRDLSAQTQVASIVDQYRLLYRSDLLNALRSALSKDELNEVTNIISQKPIGVTKVK